MGRKGIKEKKRRDSDADAVDAVEEGQPNSRTDGGNAHSQKKRKINANKKVVNIAILREVSKLREEGIVNISQAEINERYGFTRSTSRRLRAHETAAEQVFFGKIDEHPCKHNSSKVTDEDRQQFRTFLEEHDGEHVEKDWIAGFQQATGNFSVKGVSTVRKLAHGQLGISTPRSPKASSQSKAERKSRIGKSGVDLAPVVFVSRSRQPDIAFSTSSS